MARKNFCSKKLFDRYDSPERGRGGPGPLPGQFSPPPPELPKHLSRGPSREHIPEQMKNKIEVCIVLLLLIDFYNITTLLGSPNSSSQI